MIKNKVNLMVNKEAEMFHKQGMAFLKEGNNKKALEFFDKATKFDDTFFPAWNNKGVLLLELKDYKKAEKCFEQAIRFNPADKMALYNRGYALLILEDYETSVEIFEFFIANVSKKNDFYIYALYLQAKGYYGLKEYDKAQSLLNEALGMDKNFKEAQELLNEVLKEME